MCKEKGIITKWPKKIYVYAHFLRADLASFSDFFRKKTKVSGIRKTVTTMTETYGVDIKALLARRAQPEPMILKDSQRKKHMTLIAFVDTMLHTPRWNRVGNGRRDDRNPQTLHPRWVFH
ncbi:hypothetical protein [Aeromonas veronii]|uniref:hypothetical protein n=1 Tax=Aeromonas veronii TaxID=654 RepID=UPI002444D2BE|nr:hypothetical protein [Aeromonas veronii]